MKNTQGDQKEGERFEAEYRAHKAFGVDQFWERYDFSAMFQDRLSPGVVAFMQAMPFFFIATANQQGECDCSFRGRDHDASGLFLDLLHVVNERNVIFPDFSGNKFFNSLGNVLSTGQIGMLFIDFERRLRLRVNGRANVINAKELYAHLWPQAERYVRVEVTQVFGNCQKRIPRMKLLSPNDNDFQDEP